MQINGLKSGFIQDTCLMAHVLTVNFLVEIQSETLHGDLGTTIFKIIMSYVPHECLTTGHILQIRARSDRVRIMYSTDIPQMAKRARCLLNELMREKPFWSGTDMYYHLSRTICPSISNSTTEGSIKGFT